MNKIGKKTYYFAVLTAVIMTCFSMMGLLCFVQIFHNDHQVEAAQTTAVTSTVSLIDRIADGMLAPDGRTRPEATGGKKAGNPSNKNKFSLFIIYFATTFLISESSIISLLVVFIGIRMIFGCSKYNILMRMLKPPPEIHFYRFWRLKFIDPLQKFIKVLSGKYDSNPLEICGLRSVAAH